MRNLDLTALEDLGNSTPVSSGAPLELLLDDVIEDPDQPRIQFDESALDELAASIKAAGKVKHPISVKPANADGKYIINDGARRYRGSKRAGMKTIRAFVDDDHDTVDQVIANLLREDLTPREIGDALKKEIDAKHVTPADICARTGKDKTWVSRHLRIANAPQAVRDIADRCPDYKALANLVGAYEQNPDTTMAAVGSLEHITRGDVNALLASLNDREPGNPGSSAENNSGNKSGKPAAKASAPASPGGSEPAKAKTPSSPASAPNPFDHLYSQQSEGVSVADILAVLPKPEADRIAKQLAKFNKDGAASADNFTSEVVGRLFEGTFSVHDGEGFYRLIAFVQGGADKKATPANRLLESVLGVAASSIRA